MSVLRFSRIRPSTIIATTLCLAVITGLAFHSAPTHADDTSTAPIPPATPLIVSVKQATDHTTIDWQAAQPGTYPIKDYRVERSDDGGTTYTVITTTPATQTTYDDPASQTTSSYEIIADDDQDPANTSPASDPMTVTAPSEPSTPSPSTTDSTEPAQPAPTVTQDAIDLPDNTPGSSVSLQDTAALDQQTGDVDQLLQTPLTDQSSERISQAGNIRAAQLQSAINNNRVTLVQPLLNRFSYEKLNLYDHLDRLSSSQKQQIGQQCEAQNNVLETSLLSVPEPNQLDTITAIASCELLIQQ